jgi:hypothetical protein
MLDAIDALNFVTSMLSCIFYIVSILTMLHHLKITSTCAVEIEPE